MLVKKNKDFLQKVKNTFNLNYISDLVRGTKIPSSETLEGWEAWAKEARNNHPVRFWTVEYLFPKILQLLLLPGTFLKSVKIYFINRFINKTHALTSNSLKKGEFVELETRILHCLFDELVNFVEKEVAWLHCLCNEEAKEKYASGVVAKTFLKQFLWKSPEAGLAHLKWASGLVCDESWGLEPEDPSYGQLTQQAQEAIEIIELYKWWIEDRPNRKDLYEKYNTTLANFFKEVRDLEQSYLEEDETMLIRLIKVRRGLWT